MAQDGSGATSAAKLADENTSTSNATVEQARRFLQDSEVQNTSHERKAEFLRTKGFDRAIVEALTKEAGDQEPGGGDVPAPPTEEMEKEEISTGASGADFEGLEQPAQERHIDQPPIITYPEFLARRAQPSPLVTVDGFLNTLYAFGGLSALLYGTSKYILAPMVESLTEARISLHGTAADRLSMLVEKLESSVSELPASAAKGGAAIVQAHDPDEDDSSRYDDPTELFHRDVGVQTSPPPSPGAPASRSSEPKEVESAHQARRLAQLAADVRTISDGLMSQSEDFAETTRVLGMFQNDLDKLTYRASPEYFGVGGYGPSRAMEPDDEIQRARDNIRRVKGVLLSARTFPSTAR